MYAICNISLPSIYTYLIAYLLSLIFTYIGLYKQWGAHGAPNVLVKKKRPHDHTKIRPAAVEWLPKFNISINIISYLWIAFK